jgi:3-methyladenine DNA glycosylase AlkD
MSHNSSKFDSQNQISHIHFSEKDYFQLIEKLHSLADKSYKNFHSKLIPGVTTTFLGVRVPILRKIAKKLLKENYMDFINYAIKSNIYEIIMLAGMIIGQCKIPLNEKFYLLDNFIPLIDNWAICDITCSDLKETKKSSENIHAMYSYLQKWLNSSKEYEVRWALVMLLDYYICDEYIDDVISIYDNIGYKYASDNSNDNYYIRMSIAWGLSICYITYRDKTIDYLKSNTKLDKFTYNKTIQKIRESYRVTDTDKKYLSSLKMK